jgi:ornithine decarboxylase
VITTRAMMPTLDVGDLVVAPFMGAYTSVTACEFNGLPKATVVVV